MNRTTLGQGQTSAHTFWVDDTSPWRGAAQGTSPGDVGDGEDIDTAPSVRAATANEVPRLASFFANALRVIDSPWREDRVADLTSVTELARHGQFVVLDSTCGRDVLGAFHMKYEQGHMRVAMLAVAPTSHRRGLGRRLLDIAESFASALGCDSVVVDLQGQSQELRRWYGRMGYADHGMALSKRLAAVA